MFNENDPKTLNDKRRQNFRITFSNYKLINNKLYYNKSKNKEDLYKIPFESEKLNLLSNTHLENGHIVYVRLYNEILEKKFILKNMYEECKSFVVNCITCLKLRGGKKITLYPKQIVTTMPKVRKNVM